MTPTAILRALILFGFGTSAFGQSASYWMHHPVDPGELYKELHDNPSLEQNNNGEPFAWHSAGGGAFVQGYKIWGDTAWLDYAVKYNAFLLEHMVVEPDGYRGLLGRNFRSELWSDEQVSDALILSPLLKFAECVLNDDTLRAQYGTVASQYVAYAEKHVMEKWDTRGLWHEIGDYGDYIFGKQFVDPKDPTQWITNEADYTGGMSQKFNIANKLGLANIYLYRITGKECYRDKAEKLFFRMKSNFQLIGDRYSWHYWMPFWEEDVLFDEHRLIHWTNVHPYRPGYQAAEVGQIVEAYHNGIVFTETDMRRIINTNLKLMWNGDFEHPEFINSNGIKPRVTAASNAFMKTHSGSGAANKGTLWSGLIDFDPTIRTLYEKGLQNPKTAREKINAAYYYTQVQPTPPSFQRHYAGKLKVIEKDVPFGTSSDLVVATVIPHIIRRGTDSVILAKSPVSGPLSIDLYSKYGSRLIRNLYKGDIIGNPDGQKGFSMVKWDGIDPLGQLQFEGEYRVRWSFPDGYRDYEIEIIDP